MIALHVATNGEEETLLVNDEDIVTFPEGLVGCAAWRRFVLLDVKEDNLLHFLQCLDEPTACVVVTDPRLILPGYSISLSQGDREFLGLGDGQDGVVLCTVRYREELRQATANLLGPLIINPKTRLGRQVVLADSDYSPCHPVRGHEAQV